MSRLVSKGRLSAVALRVIVMFSLSDATAKDVSKGKEKAKAKTIEKITPLVTVGAAPPAAPSAAPKTAPPKPFTSTAPVAPAAAKAAKKVQPPPAGSGMVWANPDSKIYHKEGSRWY